MDSSRSTLHERPAALSLLITGGTFTHIANNDSALHSHRRYIRESFKGYVALDATHDTNGPVGNPRCHPKTRIAILRRLAKWVRNKNISRHILWVFGPVGVGKSAIAGTTADILYKEGQLAASFFFRLGDPQNLGKLIITTIAFQMAFSIPELQPHIAYAVDTNPMIFHQSLETQAEVLIVGPIQSSMPECTRQWGIIIDGLDLCKDPDIQHRILEIVGSIAARLSGKLKFIIFSRPTSHISSAFNNLPALKSDSFCINLMSDLHIVNDIRVFLKDRYEQIKMTPSLLDPSGLGEELIEFLVAKSYGKFSNADAFVENNGKRGLFYFLTDLVGFSNPFII
ncbi:hypothetical protein GALMADRAFT_143019 [Galerina marginata CBS 339.88]|uniref:Nephrocystin 3-like N-terminal domain-containing protein n=1 Tax=Galerina marginata (strain CBS 339.88) TaxID=685588 RepID=A0A067SRQ8_GALM3|nr:hypothetical protein GALMADRAFT_143019 [Galerina marginata CBS 339.88]